ncbi:AI-2E family transporter [Ferruginibacter sp. SUN002]|uniref:AI-2E family transporter n=1 Tax=Ferruginibacter sp. SUN002 TaxID=2937789 RepID=UPI003D366B87
MIADIKFPFYAKASLVFIGLFAFIAVLFYVQDIIVPVIYSTIIAIVLSPAVDFLVRRKINRALAIAFTLALVISILIAFITLLSAQLIQFSDSFPALVIKSHYILDQSIAWVSSHFNISTAKINFWVNEKNAELMNGSGYLIGQTILNTGGVLIVLFLIPVYVFMILFYQPLLLEFIHRLFSSSNQVDVSKVLTDTKIIIRSYLVGLLFEAVIVAVLNSVSLLILGVQYAILLGVIGAILNLIPYIGGIVAVALPMIIAIVTKSPSYCLLVLGAYILIQFIDNNYIMPKIVASKVKINALVSIIVVIAGGALWGIPGMFLSIPLIAIVKVIFDHIESLKPWGYLLGDTMPAYLGIKFPFKKKYLINALKSSDKNNLKKHKDH